MGIEKILLVGGAIAGSAWYLNKSKEDFTTNGIKFIVREIKSMEQKGNGLVKLTADMEIQNNSEVDYRNDLKIEKIEFLTKSHNHLGFVNMYMDVPLLPKSNIIIESVEISIDKALTGESINAVIDHLKYNEYKTKSNVLAFGKYQEI